MGDRRKANQQKAQMQQRTNKTSRPKLRPIRNICVYCGSNVGINPAYADAAHTLGRMMANIWTAPDEGAGNSAPS